MSQALSQDLQPEEPSEDKPVKFNCISCDGLKTVEKDPDHVYHNKELDLKINIPAYICSECDTLVYEPKDYAVVLEAEEKAQGRTYTKVEIRNGKVNKYSVH